MCRCPLSHATFRGVHPTMPGVRMSGAAPQLKSHLATERWPLRHAANMGVRPWEFLVRSIAVAWALAPSKSHSHTLSSPESQAWYMAVDTLGSSFSSASVSSLLDLAPASATALRVVCLACLNVCFAERRSAGASGSKPRCHSHAFGSTAAAAVDVEAALLRLRGTAVSVIAVRESHEEEGDDDDDEEEDDSWWWRAVWWWSEEEPPYTDPGSSSLSLLVCFASTSSISEAMARPSSDEESDINDTCSSARSLFR
mmetsp:Transcript_57529/g.115513  ORF Transcript_57529/g.115513 Transcript_57529/m.115513 type:complete len:255 (-) Transcript_57529:38-802(-)